jgi:hypothetical protein
MSLGTRLGLALLEGVIVDNGVMFCDSTWAGVDR